MNILYIGAGFVGTCSAAISANSGHNTLVYDIDENKIKMLSSFDRDTIESCLFEQGLGDLLVRNKERVNFTTDYAKVKAFLDSAKAVFMCLPTPEIGETGESDLRFYNSALSQLATTLSSRNNGEQSNYILVINKSTVPIDMVEQTKFILEKEGVKNFGVVSNPEFLVEGKAIEGSMRPDRVVVGAEKEEDFAMMRQIYQRFYDSPTIQYIEVNPEEAAAGKLLANFYLFNKLAICFDVIGRTCETFSKVKFENIRKILTTDERIGGWGFYNSLYAGGSCFIKDARSLSFQLEKKGQKVPLVNESYLANKRQLNTFLKRATTEADFDWQDKKVALLGLAFKRDTNDIRNSPSIEIVNFLFQQKIARISVYDPVATDNFKKVFQNQDKLFYSAHEFEAIHEADAIIIATDWPQFRGLADILLLEIKNRPLIMDGRRMLQHRYEDLKNSGYRIIAVGSSYVSG
jgi:UDPglucose 6-dehydrogenase